MESTADGRRDGLDLIGEMTVDGYETSDEQRSTTHVPESEHAWSGTPRSKARMLVESVEPRDS